VSGWCQVGVRLVGLDLLVKHPFELILVGVRH